MKCFECSATEVAFTMKLIPTNRRDSFFPKFIPQIRRICVKCGRYQTFVAQTPEIIDMFNIRLLKVKVKLLIKSSKGGEL